MSGYLIWICFLLAISLARAQEAQFVRDGGTYRFVAPREIIVLTPPVDQRPFWLRVLRSLRPWVASTPHSRLEWNDELNLYQLDGAIGVGIRGKVDF